MGNERVAGLDRESSPGHIELPPRHAGMLIHLNAHDTAGGQQLRGRVGLARV